MADEIYHDPLISCTMSITPADKNVKSESARTKTSFVGGIKKIFSERIKERRRAAQNPVKEPENMIIDRIALILAVIGGLNWGLVGLFRFDLVAYIFGGQTATVSRIVYTLVGIAAIWCISLLFRERDAADDQA